LITGSEGAKSVLHTIAQLSEHGLWNILRILRHEINANPFGANEPYALNYLVFDYLWQVCNRAHWDHRMLMCETFRLTAAATKT
jgi:hypothetical protein